MEYASVERFFTGAFGAVEMIIDARTCSGARFRRPTNEETTWKIKTSRFIQPGDTGPPYWGPGDRYTFLITGAQQQRSLFHHGRNHSFRRRPPLHIHHSREESFYLLKGTLEIALGEKRSWPRME